MSFLNGQTIGVWNVSGGGTVAATGGYQPIKMTLQGDTTIEITPALYGYKSSIVFPVKRNTKSDGTVGEFDNGAAYDRYICEFDLLLEETEANALSAFYKTNSRATSVFLTPAGDFSPFSPLRGSDGPFTVRILDFKEGGLEVSTIPKKYFRYTLKIQNVGTFPAHTIPPQRNEGNLDIDTITNLRYPLNGFEQVVDYRIGALSRYGTNVDLTDWTNTADSNKVKFTLTLTRGNMGALLNYLVSQRFSNTTLDGGTNGFPFGVLNGSSSTAKLLNSRLDVTHVSHDRYTLELSYIKV